MRTMRLHWPLILVAVVVLLLAVGHWIWPTASEVFDRLAAVVPLAVLVAQHLYRRIGRVRLAVDRQRFRWISRPELALNLKASYVVSGDDVIAARDGLLATMAGLDPPARKLAEGDRAITWSYSGLTIRAAIEPVGDAFDDGDSMAIEIEFVDVRRTYRAMELELKETIGALLNKVDGAMPRTAARKFYVTAQFPERNPYFGLFVAHLPPEAVTTYDIRFFETTATERDPVTVRRDGIEIVTSSARSAEALARQYLTLTPPRAA